MENAAADDAGSTNKEQLKTSDVYRVSPTLPKRFQQPDCFKGYSGKKTHPLYRTLNQDYGSKRPTIHEMPTMFHGKSQKFTKPLQHCGMYSNDGLNTFADKSYISEADILMTYKDRVKFHTYYNMKDPTNTG
ncbi:piercer of microtubule wall 1 protein [Erpetoichthys calabaricus]|uniref:Uncharacterized protein n=1 Tax=Erpetoichthys calabaricus TaxID=27687 RepID=A0A8C4SVA9_ERPCA|nr:piercer of microtubule wall 1 protein [Erpetoichthys calabaricus]